MNKIVFLLALIFVGLCFCETTINIHNQGSSPSCGQAATPASQYSYATSYGFKDGYYDNALIRDIWEEVVRKTPELKGNISPIPYLNTEQYYNISKDCLYSLNLTPFTMYPYLRKDFSFVSYDRPQLKYQYTIYATNMAKVTSDAASTTFCDNAYSTCSSAGKCSRGSFQDIATFASQNGNPPVTIYHFDTGLLSQNLVLMLKTELSALGLNATITKITAAQIQSTIVALATTNPATNILFAYNDAFKNADCPQIQNFPIRLYEFHTAPFSGGFPICPSSFKLKILVNDAISKMYEDYSYCRILLKYGYCKPNIPYLEFNPSNTCLNWSQTPTCATKKDDTETPSSSEQLLR